MLGQIGRRRTSLSPALRPFTAFGAVHSEGISLSGEVRCKVAFDRPPKSRPKHHSIERVAWPWMSGALRNDRWPEEPCTQDDNSGGRAACRSRDATPPMMPNIKEKRLLPRARAVIPNNPSRALNTHAANASMPSVISWNPASANSSNFAALRRASRSPSAIPHCHSLAAIAL